jgi:cell division protease FtsH
VALRWSYAPRVTDHRAVPEIELRDLARALTALLGEVHALAQAQRGESLSDRLANHLEVDPAGIPVLSHAFPPYQLVDVQIALESWPQVRPERSVELVGVAGEQRRFHPLSELVAGRSVSVGPVEYVDMADAPDSTRSCVGFGVFLLSDEGQRAAVLLRGADPHGRMQGAMLEILHPDQDGARRLLAELRRLTVERSVIRGQVLALGAGEGHQYGGMRFMARPDLTRDALVLPEETIIQIERHVIGIAEHGPRLRAAGQHLKRGVLLYGPPGTGKTHTLRYLLSQLSSLTTFVLSGRSLTLIGQACALARVFQPSMVVMEDIDLIAGDRSFSPVGANPLLFEVLNQIDGLGDDVDVTFLLTTNRVDILERALAERPGRVDAAVEIAPPDQEGRRRLLRLYGGRLGLDSLTDQELHETVAATEGRTATYLREVVRRAALLAAERQSEGELRVDSHLLAEAAVGLLDDRAALTRALLGGVGEPDAEPPFVSPAPAAFFPAPMNVMVHQSGVGRATLRGGFPPGEPPPIAPEE